MRVLIWILLFCFPTHGIAVQGDTAASRGMTLISEGLYGVIGSDGESYLAVNRIGLLTLGQRVQQLRKSLEARYRRDGLNRQEQWVLLRLTQSADGMLAAASLKFWLPNSCRCADGAVLQAWASTNRGTQSAARASGSGASFNEAWSFSDSLAEFTHSNGAEPANAVMTDPDACNAVAEARATCPGDLYPSAHAFAFSASPAPRCQI